MDPDCRVYVRRVSSARDGSADILRHGIVGEHFWTDLLPLANLIVLGEVRVQMKLEIDVPLEAEPTIAALKLDTLIDLSDCYDIESENA